MNVENMRKVKQYILDHAEQFDMDDWFADWHGLTFSFLSIPVTGLAERRTIRSNAEAYLDLTYHEAERLFSVNNWEQPIMDRYNNARSGVERAEAAAEQIEYMISADLMVLQKT